VYNLTPHSIVFSDADLKKMDTALAMLEEIFAGRLIEMKSEKYTASVKIKKTAQTIKMSASNESSSFINISNWVNDKELKQALGPRAIRIEEITDKIINANQAILKSCLSSINF
jgi:hypothetical protein